MGEQYNSMTAHGWPQRTATHCRRVPAALQLYRLPIGRYVNERAALPTNILTLMILGLLDLDGPSLGDRLAYRIEEANGNRVPINFSSLYPELFRLEQAGYVTVEWREAEDGRREMFYLLTESGRMQLAREKKAWRQAASLFGGRLAI